MFNNFTWKHLNFFSVDYPNINVVWTKFQNMFSTVSDVLKNLSIIKAMYWQIMKEFYEDNVMYAEIRTDLDEVVHSFYNIV